MYGALLLLGSSHGISGWRIRTSEAVKEREKIIASNDQVN
jgi:hypothetical protein